jgi:hypothetical protein
MSTAQALIRPVASKYLKALTTVNDSSIRPGTALGAGSGPGTPADVCRILHNFYRMNPKVPISRPLPVQRTGTTNI